MGGATEVIQHLAPSGIVRCTATMAFINNDQIKEIGGKLPVDLFPFLFASYRLIKRQIDFISIPVLTPSQKPPNFKPVLGRISFQSRRGSGAARLRMIDRCT